LDADLVAKLFLFFLIGYNLEVTMLNFGRNLPLCILFNLQLLFYFSYLMILVACFTLYFLLKLISFLKSFSLLFAHVIHGLVLLLELRKVSLF